MMLHSLSDKFRYWLKSSDATMRPEVELIRALAKDLVLEILASYTPDDFKDADFISLG
jgi:hypothetical protein